MVDTERDYPPPASEKDLMPTSKQDSLLMASCCPCPQVSLNCRVSSFRVLSFLWQLNRVTESGGERTVKIVLYLDSVFHSSKVHVIWELNHFPSIPTLNFVKICLHRIQNLHKLPRVYSDQLLHSELGYSQARFPSKCKTFWFIVAKLVP